MDGEDNENLLMAETTRWQPLPFHFQSPWSFLSWSAAGWGIHHVRIQGLWLHHLRVIWRIIEFNQIYSSAYIGTLPYFFYICLIKCTSLIDFYDKNSLWLHHQQNNHHIFSVEFPSIVRRWFMKNYHVQHVRNTCHFGHWVNSTTLRREIWYEACHQVACATKGQSHSSKVTWWKKNWCNHNKINGNVMFSNHYMDFNDGEGEVH